MKRLTIPAAMLILATGCPSESETPTKVPTASGVTKEVATSVKDVLAKKGPKWKVEYSGDFSGSLEGAILQATPGAGMQTAIGAAMKKDLKGSATEKIQVTFMHGEANDKLASAELTLPDGTECKTDITKKDGFSKGKVLDAAPKTFKAEVAGELLCGAAKDKKISYKATFSKKP